MRRSEKGPVLLPIKLSVGLQSHEVSGWNQPKRAPPNRARTPATKAKTIFRGVSSDFNFRIQKARSGQTAIDTAAPSINPSLKLAPNNVPAIEPTIKFARKTTSRPKKYKPTAWPIVFLSDKFRNELFVGLGWSLICR